MKGTRPAHRPKRQFSSAKRQLCQPELKTCPHCGGQLKSTRTLYINKDVQTLDGVVNVRAYGYYCSNPNCPHPEERYHAVKQVLHISLPFGTYGLDVIAFIGWQREREHRQFAEIQGRLSSRGVAISERHVGRLYRQYLALLAGLTEQITATLKETEEEYGGVIWALDGLQPDQDGTQLYVLYEVLSQTPGGAAWFDKRDAARLQTWLEPYGQLDLTVLATLSDGEEAEITAMKAVWSGVVHQMCQVHFLGDIGEPIRDGDQRLRKALAVELKKLPSLPGNPAATGVQPQARTLELEMPASDSRANTSPVEEQKETKTAQDRLHRPALRRRPGIPGKSPLGSIQGKAKRAVPASKGSRQSAQTEGGRSTPAEESAVPEGEEDTLLQMQEMEFLFRKAFQDVLRRPSRKPLTFGGLAGYEQLQSLTCTLQLQLPKGGSSYLHTLLEKGQQALCETATLAQDVHQARDDLRQIAHLLAAPLTTEAPGSKTGHGQNPLVEGEQSRGEQVKQELEATLDSLERRPRLGPVTRAFHTNTRRLLTKWEADLFHCYDIPNLPPNNADLEFLYNRLRRGQRRISGRKKTSELRRTGHFQILLRAPTLTDLWQQLRSVPLSAYQKARQRLEVAEERQRWLYRLHRWPLKTATAMVKEYLSLRRQVQVTMPAGP